MGILQEIARGGAWSGLEIAKAGVQGQRDAAQLQAMDQELQIKAMEMNDYLEKRGRERRLRSSLTGADFTDAESSAQAAQMASDVGGYETALAISKHALAQKPKGTDVFGKMQDVYVGGKKVGVGQYDNEGKLHNFKTLKQMTDKGKGGAPTKARTPTKGQIERSTDMVKKSAVFGEEGLDTFGLSSKDNKTLGRIVASRAQKLISDAKQLGETISDETAHELALAELEKKKDKLLKSDWVGYSLKKQEDTIFESGISKELTNYLGVDAPTSEIVRVQGMDDYNKLPKGAKYIDPNGVERVKQ